VTTPEIIDQIYELILEDSRISAKWITEQLGISRERVGSIIHEDLDMRPRLTTTCSLDWKKQLKSRHFSSDAEVIAAAETWLDGKTSIFFLVTCKS
jgi:hypothetical protein